MTEPAAAPSKFVEQFGGLKGIVDSGLPVVVFVLVNTVAGLHWAIGAAIAAGVFVLAARLVRREPVQFAVSGFLGVGVAAFFAWRLGGARGFFIPGIVLNAAYMLAFAVSLVVRRPLVGVVWAYLDSGDRSWRDPGPLRRAYTQATLLWTAMYAAKAGVQGLLYIHDRPGWLAVTKLAMGYPLFALIVAATVWLVRRAKATVAREMLEMPGQGELALPSPPATS